MDNKHPSAWSHHSRHGPKWPAAVTEDQSWGLSPWPDADCAQGARRHSRDSEDNDSCVWGCDLDPASAEWLAARCESASARSHSKQPLAAVSTSVGRLAAFRSSVPAPTVPGSTLEYGMPAQGRGSSPLPGRHGGRRGGTALHLSGTHPGGVPRHLLGTSALSFRHPKRRTMNSIGYAPWSEPVFGLMAL